MQQGGTRARLLRRSTCSSSTASRSSTCRCASAASGSRSCSTGATGPCASRRRSTTATRCYEAAKQQELEGIMAKRARLAVLRGPAHARLAEGQDARPPGVRHRRLHARRRPARVDVRLADPRGATRAASCATSATSAPASTTPRSAGCSRSSSRCAARRSPFRTIPKMPRVRKDEIVWVEPQLVAEVEFAEWTHDGHLRAPVVPGPARGQGARGRAPRGARPEPSRSRRTSARASAS